MTPFDPLGPGTRPWELFDRALEAYRLVPKGDHYQTNQAYKRYANTRHAMRLALAQAGATSTQIDDWCKALRRQCQE